jgi:hypothetical protein
VLETADDFEQDMIAGTTHTLGGFGRSLRDFIVQKSVRVALKRIVDLARSSADCRIATLLLAL